MHALELEPRMSWNGVRAPLGDTIRRRPTVASSTATVSHPGMNEGGRAGPVAGRSATVASLTFTPSAEIRPARISSGS
jgi:hypothetical protein